MNERIKELMDQATRSKYWNATTQVMTEDFDKGMFAELIVRECIQAVDNVGGYNEEFHMNAIKEHFGVTE
jgi:hypothetical protein